MRDLDAAYVFVDPGVHFSGVAFMQRRELLHCVLQAAAHPLDARPGVRCICERPKVYDEETQARMGRRIKSKDIEDLLIAAGRMTSALDTEYLPVASWKGSRKKEPMHLRLWEKVLAPQEKEIVRSMFARTPEKLRHNVLDAICIGMTYLGRWR